MAQIKGLLVVLTLVILANFIVALVVFVLISAEIGVLEQSQTNGKNSAQQSVVGQIESANKLGDDVIKITSGTVYPQTIINIISSSLPEGLKVTDYRLDMVRGTSVDRQQLLTFKKNLEETGKFSSVSIPVSSFEKDKDLEFEASFGFLELAKGTKKQLKLQI